MKAQDSFRQALCTTCRPWALCLEWHPTLHESITTCASGCPLAIVVTAHNRGYWLAAADPAAAGHALTGSEPLAGLSAVALLSDGASRLADRFHLATWAQIWGILTRDGPSGLIGQVRAAESADPRGERWPRGKIHDDATAVFWPIPG
jgi:hypothetical protein